MKEKFSLESYGWSGEVNDRLKPIIDFIRNNDIVVAEKKIAQFSLEVLQELADKIITPKRADDYFTVLDTYIDDNLQNIKFSEDLKDLLFEGMILHDLGKSFGADIPYMKSLIENILKK